MVRPSRLLRWLYLGRLTVAAGIFGGALVVWPQTAPATTLLVTLLLLSALGVTLASAWHTHVRGRPAGKAFLYAQVAFDALLVTAVVHLTGSGESELAPLYVLVIATGALLLPYVGGVLTGALASLLYLADVVWWQTPTPPGTVFVQLALFMVLALVVAHLADRLRRTGTALGAIESELRQLRLDTDEILEAIDTGVVTVDGSGRLVYLNAAAESLLPLPAAEWLGRPVLEELDRRAPGLGTSIRRTALRRRAIRRHETRAQGEDGRVLGVSTTVLARGDDGVAPWTTAVFEDITDGRRVQELHRRAERLEAVAELAPSLAHEIKNPLASIRSAVEQLAGGRVDASDRAVLERLVKAESDRLSRLLADFIDFSRIELRRSATVDLLTVIRDALALALQHPDGGRVGCVDFACPDTPVLVEGDGDLLHRAIFNLLLNAVQHAGEAGAVRIELGAVDELDPPYGLELAAPVRLAVSDTGTGIPAEQLARIFDPFFTTRKGGTGLGLALVHRAVEAHDGAILVDGRPGRGARFTVYLPAHADATVQ